MNFMREKRTKRLVIAVCLALAAADAPCATITVNSTDDDATSTICNLRSALASVNGGSNVGACVADSAYGSGDTIVFDTSLVNATITLAQGQLAATQPVTLLGSGQIIDANNLSRVLYIDHTTFTGSNITLQNGAASGTLAAGNGAGIYAHYGNVTLTNATVRNNVAAGNGAGVLATHGSFDIAYSTISGNSAAGKGGGIVVNHGSTLTLSSSVVSGNIGTRVGGVYSAYMSNAAVGYTLISGNTANCAQDYCSGGIYAFGGAFTLSDSTVAGNIAKGSHTFLAGGAYIYDSQATFLNSTISGNSAYGTSYLAGGLLEIHTGSTSNNGATLINCTVAANSATSYTAGTNIAGGIESGIDPTQPGNYGALTLTNSIVSANMPPNSDVVTSAKTIPLTVSYSLLGASLGGASPFNGANQHNIFSDTPGLGPLQNNGGATPTMALDATSPALHAGSASLATFLGQSIRYDQRGTPFPRASDGAIDIGAFEYQADRIFAVGFESGP
jgi:hypothetical protein